jgi:hypothetical protein
VIALILEHDNFSCLLINAYMPYENPADQNSTDDLVAQLGHVASIMDQYTNLDVIFGGDLNIDFNRNTTHTLLLREFINSRDLVSDVSFNTGLYNVDYTFHFDNRRFNTLDHFIISSRLAVSGCTRVSVEHNVDNTSDYDPLSITLPLNINHLFTNAAVNTPAKPDWHKCTDLHVNNYQEAMASL